MRYSDTDRSAVTGEEFEDLVGFHTVTQSRHFVFKRIAKAIDNIVRPYHRELPQCKGSKSVPEFVGYKEEMDLKKLSMMGIEDPAQWLLEQIDWSDNDVIAKLRLLTLSLVNDPDGNRTMYTRAFGKTLWSVKQKATRTTTKSNSSGAEDLTFIPSSAPAENIKSSIPIDYFIGF